MGCLRALVVGCLFAAPALAQRTPARLAIEPLADTPALDLSAFLKDTSLCVFPFLKESVAEASVDKSYLESIQKTFFEVARESPLLKDAVLLSQNSTCALGDAACFSKIGKSARCQNVLVGSSAAKGNGVVLSVRIFDVAKERVLAGSEVEQVLESEKPSEVAAWAEGQACRALNVKCAGRILIDADRRDMLVYVDGRVAPRSFRAPEQIGIPPGVHAVRVAIGQRSSLEKKVAVRRNGSSEVVYARQTDNGGIPLTLASELRGPAPTSSAEFKQESKWTRRAGLAAAGAGVLAGGFGLYQGIRSRSLANAANQHYTANGGVFMPGDLADVRSSESAQKTANIMLVVSGVLLASGAVLTFAF